MSRDRLRELAEFGDGLAFIAALLAVAVLAGLIVAASH